MYVKAIMQSNLDKKEYFPLHQPYGGSENFQPMCNMPHLYLELLIFST